MPKRTDISSILVIGAGPTIIGQAYEFDNPGTQTTTVPKDLSPELRTEQSRQRCGSKPGNHWQSLEQQSIRRSRVVGFPLGAFLPSDRHRPQRLDPQSRQIACRSAFQLPQEHCACRPCVDHHPVSPQKNATHPAQSTKEQDFPSFLEASKARFRSEPASTIRSRHSYRRESKLKARVRRSVALDIDLKSRSRNANDVIDKTFARQRLAARRVFPLFAHCRSVFHHDFSDLVFNRLAMRFSSFAQRFIDGVIGNVDAVIVQFARPFIPQHNIDTRTGHCDQLVDPIVYRRNDPALSKFLVRNTAPLSPVISTPKAA